MTVTKEEVPKANRVPRGRPKFHTVETRLAYFKKYYETHKDKWNADYLCPTCNLYCTFINKNRHTKSKLHLENLRKNKPTEGGAEAEGQVDAKDSIKIS